MMYPNEDNHHKLNRAKRRLYVDVFGRDLLGRDALLNRRSDQTEQIVDSEVRRMISDNYDQVRELITTHKDKLVTLAKELLEKEVLQEEDVKRILDGVA